MKSIILTHSSFQDQEVHYPFHRLREEGDEPLVIAERSGPIVGILGTKIEAAKTYSVLDQMQTIASLMEEHDLLVLPGGVKAMEKMRQVQPVLTFIAGWMKVDKPLACMCSGVQLLISAKAVKGRLLTCYPAFGIDAENAGAVYAEGPSVCIDRHLVTSPHYKWLTEWMLHAISITNMWKAGNKSIQRGSWGSCTAS